MKKIIRISSLLLCLLFLSWQNAFAAGAKEVYLGGEPFGVKFYSDGVMVIELEEFYNGAHYVCPAAKGGLQSGDIIKAINGDPIESNEEVQQIVLKSKGKSLAVRIERNGKELQKTVKPEANTSGAFLLGAWVRDSCAGIGTVTFYDDNRMAALGHGICDSDTGDLLPLSSAEVVSANISSVTKAAKGKVGSLNGFFEGRTLGNLTDNTPLGVFGTTIDNHYISNQKVEIAEFNEISPGEAWIVTCIEGSRPLSYRAEITGIHNDDCQNNENFVIKVTDSRILDECGGIVQGMSGSPILQHNKLVGAVTHVFLNDPTEGYGVAAQYMVDISRQ